jgi:cytochrome c-type biogenesis protein CcmH
MLVGLVLLPAGVAGLYLALGSPQLPDAPLAARLGGPAESRPLDSLVAQVEAHLERNPEDGRGWEVLAPVYARLGRLEDAVKARRNALRINGATAAREGDYGEALMGAANGIVTADAKAAFERARKHDPEDVKARYFLGVVAEQDGRPQEAAAIWRDMLAKAPADAPWTGFIRQSLARLGQAPIADEAGPNAAEVAAAAELSPEQRTEMVRGMVDRLAARLQQDGADVDGWLRLMRAYSVLGEAEKAKAAAADARRALSGDPDKLRRVDELVRALSLGG